MIRVQTEDFNVTALNAELRATAGGQAGATVTFVGYVRDQADGTPTQSLFLEHYPGMCEREIKAVCEQARQRWPILDTLVVHRVGELHLTEQIVYVGVTSAHRGDAFRACEFIMDVLKTRAPFWKRETLADGQRFWVQQRDSDAQKTDSWNLPSNTSKHV